jgi:ribosomal-protein-alanine N-acetyltransferase
MTNYCIRDYHSTDYPLLMKLWESLDLSNPKRGDNNEIITQSIKIGGKLLIMESSESNIIGSAWLTNDGRRIYLHHFGIHKQWQNKGLGKVLLKECLQFAKENRMQIKLEVHKDNNAALKLYKKGGFKYLGDYLVYIIRDI